MALFKVKIEQGAFINDSLFRMDEIVELDKGLDPLWGVKCDANGNELEDHSEKIRNSNKINEHLAKSIEGDNSAANKAIAKENAELKIGMQNMQEQIEKLTSLMTDGANAAPEETKGKEADGNTGAAPNANAAPPMDAATIEQVDEAVKLLEDANDAHWTQKDEPKLEALKEITGLDLSRADVDGVNDRRRVKPQA